MEREREIEEESAEVVVREGERECARGGEREVESLAAYIRNTCKWITKHVTRVHQSIDVKRCEKSRSHYMWQDRGNQPINLPIDQRTYIPSYI